MRAIYKLPGQMPEIIEVDNTLEALQQKVGGYIEAVKVLADVTAVCNEEGRIRDMKENCDIFGISFCGPVLLVSKWGDEFTDLSDAAIRVMLPYLKMKEEKKCN